MPVLDLEQWIERIEIEGDSRYQILHSYYKKKIGSKKSTAKYRLSPQGKQKISMSVSKLQFCILFLAKPEKEVSPGNTEGTIKEESDDETQYCKFHEVAVSFFFFIT